MTKEALRQLYQSQRLSISSNEKLKLDDLLLIQFQHLFFENVQVLLTYWPMAHRAEPNTHLFSGYLRHIIPALQIAYPLLDIAAGNFHAVKIDEETVYRTNIYGIAEPEDGPVLEASKIDLVFVPLLICDINGFRVGYGKGFYDKYLSQCRNDLLKIGFSYFAPVDNINDTAPFDVPLDFCITPEKVYEF